MVCRPFTEGSIGDHALRAAPAYDCCGRQRPAPMTDSGRISFSLRELARRFGGEIAGDPAFEVRGVASLESAAPDRLAFLAHARFPPQLQATPAGAVILG